YCPRVPPMGLVKQLRGFRRKTARRKGAEYEACQANHHRFGLTCRAVAGRWSSFQGFLAALKEVQRASRRARAAGLVLLVRPRLGPRAKSRQGSWPRREHLTRVVNLSQ